MNQPDFPQNPDELFDVLLEDSTHTGIVKRRADVHRDGDWHRAIHVWVYGVGANGPFILFNRRSLNKDTWPGKLDVTVGGHLAAGETTDSAFREIEEEIGIDPAPGMLQPLFTRQAYGETERELQDVFLFRDDRPLQLYQPNPAELEGLVTISLRDALSLFRQEVTSLNAIELVAATRELTPLMVDETNLLPPSSFDYFLTIAQAIASELAGEFRLDV